MRLIDADALLAAYDATHKGPPGNTRRLIEDAPIIAAIPVEWLKDKELDYRTIGDKMFSDAFAVVIGEW